MLSADKQLHIVFCRSLMIAVYPGERGQKTTLGPVWLHPGPGRELKARPEWSYLFSGLDSTSKFFLGTGPWQYKCVFHLYTETVTNRKGEGKH